MMASAYDNSGIVLPLTATLLASIDGEAAKPCRKGSFDDEVSTACSQGRAEGLPCWTKRRVLALCEELLQGYFSPHFQQELKKLSANAPSDAQVAGRMELALTVQREILPKYGFSGTVEGVEAMRNAVCPFLVDWMVRKLVDEMDKVLGLAQNSTENAAKGPRGTRDALSISSEDSETMEQMSTPRLRSESIRSESMAGSEDKPRLRVGPPSRRQDFSLSKARLLELLGDVLQAFSSSDFQQEFQQLPVDSAERKELVLKAKTQVLQKHKFPGSAYGVMLMVDAITPFVDDFLVKYLLSQMDEKIGLPTDTTANICRGMTVKSEPANYESVPKGSRFSRRQILMLCDELLQGFKKPEFQKELQALLERSKNKTYVPERAALAMTVQSVVLPKYGLSGTTSGVLSMLDEIAPHGSDWMVAALVNSIDEALGLPAGTTLQAFHL